MDSAQLLERESFVEKGARERVRRLLDANSMRELLDPFERLRSPWLAMQDIVTQADDGVVIARGTIDGVSVVIAAIEPTDGMLLGLAPPMEPELAPPICGAWNAGIDWSPPPAAPPPVAAALW